MTEAAAVGSVAVPDANCRELAAAFRWTARLGMHEAVANHFSLAVDEAGQRFLINPVGRNFARIRASDLLVADAGKEHGGHDTEQIDPTAWALHGAIHRMHPSIRCVLHAHPRWATALAILRDSRLPPVDQNAMRFFNRMVIDEEFHGMGLGEEAERVARLAEPAKPILLLAQHGVMAFGNSVALAFDALFYFERACETYLTALATGRELRIADDGVAEKTARQWERCSGSAQQHLDEIMDILDQEEPDYAT